MKIPTLHLAEEAKRPFLQGALVGSVLGIVLGAAGIGAWSIASKHAEKEPYTAQSPFDPSQLEVQSLHFLAGRNAQPVVQAAPIAQAQPVQATPIGAAAVPTGTAAPGSPIPLPNVPNVPLVQAQPQQQAPQPIVQAQPVVQAQPQTAPAPKTEEAAHKESAVVRGGETFSDGRIAYFGGMAVPHEQTGENYGT